MEVTPVSWERGQRLVKEKVLTEASSSFLKPPAASVSGCSEKPILPVPRSLGFRAFSRDRPAAAAPCRHLSLET